MESMGNKGYWLKLYLNRGSGSENSSTNSLGQSLFWWIILCDPTGRPRRWARSSLNPCFDGSYSVTPVYKHIQREGGVRVSILVLMDHTLWRLPLQDREERGWVSQSLFWWIILCDHGVRGTMKGTGLSQSLFWWIILCDFKNSGQDWHSWSLNPCFDGSYSVTTIGP